MVNPGEFSWCNTDIPCSMNYECEECKFYNRMLGTDCPKYRRNIKMDKSNFIGYDDRGCPIIIPKPRYLTEEDLKRFAKSFESGEGKIDKYGMPIKEDK